MITEVILKNLIIKPHNSIKEALKKIDLSGQRCIYVEKNNRLIGSLTDGDIRRAILSGASLQETAEHTISLLLSLYRNINEANKAVDAFTKVVNNYNNQADLVKKSEQFIKKYNK